MERLSRKDHLSNTRLNVAKRLSKTRFNCREAGRGAMRYLLSMFADDGSGTRRVSKARETNFPSKLGTGRRGRDGLVLVGSAVRSGVCLSRQPLQHLRAWQRLCEQYRA